MSGTSMDGLDLAHCTFEESSGSFSYTLGACETIPYPDTWLMRLKNLPFASALEYAETHTEYGRYIGELIEDFVNRNSLVTDFVASHGHTIFHNPAKRYTSQIGDGAAIAAACKLPVVCDFRSTDVAASGQGAPLVPIGDQLLFAGYDYCLNLGGFANISMQKQEKRIAYDIAPVNIILNYIAGKKGKTYDKNGEMAASGKVHHDLLNTLNNLGFYQMEPPKSLGREWIENEILPMLALYNISHEDAAKTFCEHIAVQIAACLDNNQHKQMLVTGGGTFNTHLMHCIKSRTAVKLIVPDPKTINYKEALVFAFLGLLRMENKPNCLASVTGATHDVSGGAVYLP
jgi:anhydro-N-acetylmuramic acid kinase